MHLAHRASPSVAASRAPKAVLPSIFVARPRASVLLRKSPATTAQQQRVAPARAIGGGGGSGGSGGAGGGGGGGGGGNNSNNNNDPHPLRPFAFAYAAFLLVGGIFAYVKSSSTKSLTAAGGSAVVIALAARSLTGGPAATRGPLIVIAAMSAVLAYVMSKRYSKTRKVMPAGVTAGLSFGMALASAAQVAGASTL